MSPDRELRTSKDGTRRESVPKAKRRYQLPVLTEYGSIEDLVDAGVVGEAVTVPSLTPDRA